MPKTTMLHSELQELMGDVADVKLRDVHLGRVLEKFVTHLAHAHGLEPAALAEESASSEEEDSADEEEAPKPKGKGK